MFPEGWQEMLGKIHSMLTLTLDAGMQMFSRYHIYHTPSSFKGVSMVIFDNNTMECYLFCTYIVINQSANSILIKKVPTKVVLKGPWTSESNFMEIHPAIVEAIQCQPQSGTAWDSNSRDPPFGHHELKVIHVIPGPRRWTNCPAPEPYCWHDWEAHMCSTAESVMWDQPLQEIWYRRHIPVQVSNTFSRGVSPSSHFPQWVHFFTKRASDRAPSENMAWIWVETFSHCLVTLDQLWPILAWTGVIFHFCLSVSVPVRMTDVCVCPLEAVLLLQSGCDPSAMLLASVWWAQPSDHR